MENILAFLAIAIVYYIGEVIGTKSKASIPSVFITAMLFLVGYWTIFPKDIVELAGMGPPLGGLLVILLCITHMGTIISIKQLLEQWRVIVVTLVGLAGMIALVWFIVMPIVGREFVISGLPPLTGGIVAATMMNEAALELGLISAAVLAIAMYAVQGFVGYPLTAFLLKKEGKLLLDAYHKGEHTVKKDSEIADESSKTIEKDETPKKKLIPAMPKKYSTNAFILGKLMFAALIANRLGFYTGLNQAVWALFIGILFTEIGFLEKDALNKANSYGFLMFLLMVYVFSGLKDSTPEILMEAIGPMAIIIVVGVTGMGIGSIIAGKVLGLSLYMSFAVSLTALYGFPPNYILTEEAVNAMAKTPEENKYLMDEMLPMMIVGGFVTVTITSVIVAGIFVDLL